MFKVGDKVRFIEKVRITRNDYESYIVSDVITIATEDQFITFDKDKQINKYFHENLFELVENQNIPEIELKLSNVELFDILGYMNESCSHEFVSYIGLTHTFNYCKKCDKKE